MKSLFPQTKFAVCCIIIASLLSSCNTNKYEAEDELLHLTYSEFDDDGDSINRLHIYIAQTLLENKVIPDTTAETYFYILNYIVDHDEAPFEGNLIAAQKLKQYLKNDTEAFIDTQSLKALAEKYPNSKLVEIGTALSDVSKYDESFLRIIIKNIELEDLHHPFYKQLAMLLIAKSNDIYANYWNKEYQPKSDQVYLNKRNTLLFYIDSNGIIKNDRKVVSVEEVGHRTQLFLTRESSTADWVSREIPLVGKQPVNTGIVMIGISPKLTEDEILPLYSCINNAYTVIRARAAQDHFKKDFFYLSPQERHSVKLLTRKWISIHEQDYPQD